MWRDYVWITWDYGDTSGLRRHMHLFILYSVRELALMRRGKDVLQKRLSRGGAAADTNPDVNPWKQAIPD